MPRHSKREELTTALHAYLAIAEMHTPEEYPLDCRSVAKALDVSPTTLYKYQLQEQIGAAAHRQQENGKQAAKKPSHSSPKERIRQLTGEVKQTEERNKHLVARIALIEANAARLGIDPEELYRPVLKPIRSVSHAGQSGTKQTQQARHMSQRG